MNKVCLLLFVCSYLCQYTVRSQDFDPGSMKNLLYGVAYYYEYMPYERLEEDARMMKECGINVVRICESTWGTMEPREGEFNLEYVGRILDVMHSNGIQVIVGTPTYAIPSWMALKHPEVMAETRRGRNIYGARQQMDITNQDYLYYAERIIRKLIEAVHDHPAVIGYQVDNETKHYNTSGESVQKLFVEYLKKKFISVEEMNRAYGLNYWSNTVGRWEDFPSTLGTINASIGCEFSKFQRSLVTEFLAWQVSIINEYKRPEQFITQNFDLGWRNGSYGIQPDVDHFEAARSMDIAGIDIYHQTQDELDGLMIALGGDLARSMKQQNYLVLETQAQSILNSTTQKLHYPGQLRLQAFSHLASGANMVAYWPWHSIHNSMETYWKGILSHDLQPNPTYEEVKVISGEFEKYGNEIINLTKRNKVAIYFSNESLTAIEWFGFSSSYSYNDLVVQYYRSLYKMNIEADFIDHTTTDLSSYELILVPSLYVASDEELFRLNEFVKVGGHILYGFRSGFSNENTQVRSVKMPGLLSEAAGISYQQFTRIEKIPLKGNPFLVDEEKNYVSEWAELLQPEKAEVLASYEHPHWGKYAALTRNNYGKGTVTYLGTYTSDAILDKIIAGLCSIAGINEPASQYRFPLIVRSGFNSRNEKINYFFNYSSESISVPYLFPRGKDLVKNRKLKPEDALTLLPWDFTIIKDD